MNGARAKENGETGGKMKGIVANITIYKIYGKCDSVQNAYLWNMPQYSLVPKLQKSICVITDCACVAETSAFSFK